jgi:hypothetical protein
MNMNVGDEKEKFSYSTILFASLRIVLRNIVALLIVFAVSHIPVYVINAFINQAGLGLTAENLTSLESTAGPISAALVSSIMELLALTFSLICCAKVTETARLGKTASIIEPLGHGVSTIGKAFVTLSPFFAVYILILAISVIILNIQICLGFLLIVPMMLLALFHYLVTISVSIRGQSGWQTYSYAWKLAKGEWQYLIGNYLIMGFIVVLISCPFTVAATQLLQSSAGVISSIGGMTADFLSAWIAVGITLCFLDIEDRKSKPSTGLELPYGGPIKEE